MLVLFGHDLSGTTAQRPSNVEAGQHYYNTTLGQLEVYTGSAWQAASSTGGVRQVTGGADAALVTDRYGDSATEGYEIRVIDETLSALAAVSTDLTEDVPSGAVILSVQANIETACVAGGTSVKVGVGTTGDPDKYGKTTDLTQNQKIDTLPAHAVLSSAEDIQVNATATAGGIGDTAFSAGAVRVRIVYAMTNSLDDAA